MSDLLENQLVLFSFESGCFPRRMYPDRDTFDFSQGHVTKNPPMEVPV